MGELNNIGINSVERSESQKQKGRPYHRDREEFKNLHSSKLTDDELKTLKYLFDRRGGIEEEKFKLEKKMKNLERQFDNSSCWLNRMRNGPPIGYFLVNGGMNNAIHETGRDLDYIKAELEGIKWKIQSKDEEIDKLNISINNEIQELCGDVIPESVSKQKSRKAETVENIKSLFEQTNNRSKN